MGVVFADTGQSSDVGLGSPTLQGIYLPGIDNPDLADGLGIYTPWGGGSTARKYGDYGPSEGDTQLRDLNNGLFSSAGQGVSYNIEGLTGPQGPPGPAGPPGQVTIQQLLYPVGSADLSSLLLQLQAQSGVTDTLTYGAATHIEWNETWVPMPVAATKTWNDFALNHDGSFMLIASDLGLYVSTNTGSSWAAKTVSPAEGFLMGNVSDASGNAVSLGETSRVDGKFWASSNYGSTWAQVVLSTD